MGAEKSSILESADELVRMKQVLGRIAETLLVAEAETEPGTAARKLDAASIRAVVRARRLRDHFFRSDLFSDPAWDMMLDLLAARLEGQRVAVSSLCIAAAVPPTTALRWIKTLCDDGIFVRTTDPADSRRVYIELGEETAKRLEAYFKSVGRLGMTSV